MRQSDSGVGFLIGFLLGAMVVIVFGIYFFHVSATDNRAEGYRQGQIDAMQGKIKYRPVARIEWEEAKP